MILEGRYFYIGKSANMRIGEFYTVTNSFDEHDGRDVIKICGEFNNTPGIKNDYRYVAGQLWDDMYAPNFIYERDISEKDVFHFKLTGRLPNART